MKNFRAWKFYCFILSILASSVAAQAQGFSVVYQFSPASVAAAPHNPGIIAQGRDGNLYSTAQGGNIFRAAGTVFEIVPPNAMNLKLSFHGADGSDPYGGLTLGTDGNFYGATVDGGTHNWGVVYKITPGGSETVPTVLHSFTGVSPDGGLPWASPIQGTDGNFYGTTLAGSSVYKITPSGTFKTLSASPGWSKAPLVQGTDGLFYGVTEEGGPNQGYGTVFKVTSAGHVTVLHPFTSGTDGANPVGGLTQGLDGNFYGTTENGGGTSVCTGHTGGCGTVFKITPSGKLTPLYQFKGGSDEGVPFGGLVQGSDGNFYGTTTGVTSTDCGTIFRITPAGAFSTLYTFDKTTGCHPGTLVQRTTGVLYGDTGGVALPALVSSTAWTWACHPSSAFCPRSPWAWWARPSSSWAKASLARPRSLSMELGR